MTFDAAGIVGIDPRPFTLRELHEMRVARESEAWDRTAPLLSFLSGFGKEPKPIEYFHPYRSEPKKTAELTPERLVSLKGHFPKWQDRYFS